jgi:hypothetical protein
MMSPGDIIEIGHTYSTTGLLDLLDSSSAPANTSKWTWGGKLSTRGLFSDLRVYVADTTKESTIIDS